MLNKKHLILLFLAVVILTAYNKNEVPKVANQVTTSQEQSERTKIKEKPTDTNIAEIKNSKPINNLQQVISQVDLYKNERLGFSFVVPESWKGKYLVKEEQNGIRVFYKPIDPVKEGQGLLFAILNRTSLEDEHTFDTVGEPRTFEVNGITYIIGGPTDVSFPEGHKEFADFIKLQKQVREVVKTIKTID